MSGHSKWSTIKRQKGVADIKRGMTFTKISNVISLAARVGGSGDPESNPRLRAALDSARKVNMPKENIQRAIDRGLGKLPGQSLEEITYEGFGPGRVAFFLEGVTDNKLRTNSEIRNLFERAGGSLGSLGSTSYMFDKVGVLSVSRVPQVPQGQKPHDTRDTSTTRGTSNEEDMLELIDLGAEDVEDFEEPFDDAQGKDIQRYLVYVESSELNTMSTKITQAGYEIESAEIAYKPNLSVNISDKEIAQKVLNFTQKLEENDDIQKVYANFDIPDELAYSV